MKKGFTLIEILIVIAVMAILAFLILSSFPKVNSAQALSKDTANVAAVLNQARALTLTSKDDSVYGVHLESARVVLFKGSTYNANDPLNVSIPLNTLVNILGYTLTGGGSDVVFDRLTGKTAQPGTVTLALVASPSDNKVITIAATGVIDATP